MSGQLSMFNLPTSEDSGSATSSPGSAAGPTPSDSPDGLMIGPSGPGPAPVSPSRVQGKVTAKPIRAIFGRRGFGSSASAALTSSLVNKLKPRLGAGGSTVFQQTWKEKTTPSGRWYWAHTASTRTTSDSGSGSWPTPAATELGNSLESYDRMKANMTSGPRTAITALSQMAQTCWPTTTKEDGRSSARHGYMIEGNQGTTLLDAARMTSWPTPKESDSDKGVRTMRGAEKELGRKGPGSDLPTLAAAAYQPTPLSPSSPNPTSCASWPTPTSLSPATEDYNEAGDSCNLRKTRLLVSPRATPQQNDFKGAPTKTYQDRGGEKKGEQLSHQAVHMAWVSPQAADANGSGINQHTASLCKQARQEASGPPATGSPAETGKSGQLNPAHSRWLMGYPKVWDQCAIRLSLKSKKG